MILSVTGHRPNKLGNEYSLKGPFSNFIRQELRKVIEQEKPDELISGMALGVDMIFALLGIELQIPVIAAIPCVGQESRWPYESQKLYQSILENRIVTPHFVSDKTYTNSCMQDRNIWMIDNCQKLAAVWNGTSGGTGNAVKYAKSIGREIIRINPNDVYSRM
jgi:uncharacterized phage-like protein YoqJ